jgi:alpha-1,4-digalacturonate transport system permease protein
VVLLLAMIRAVQIFDLIYAFTGGGPGTATLFLVQYIYQNGFASAVKRLGIASSASLLMGGVLILLTILQLSRERGKR